MDEQIEDKLNEIYNFNIKVDFVDFRIYRIRFKFENEIIIDYFYDVLCTLEYNTQKICEKINQELIKLFLNN